MNKKHTLIINKSYGKTEMHSAYLNGFRIGGVRPRVNNKNIVKLRVNSTDIFNALGYVKVQNNDEIKKIIEECRIMEEDHEPDGYPCVKMGWISRLVDILEGK